MQISDNEIIEIISLVINNKSINETASAVGTYADDQFVAGYVASIALMVTYLNMKLTVEDGSLSHTTH